MIKLDNLIQLKAFARQDGALLSLLWTASFAAVIYAPQTPLGNILALAPCKLSQLRAKWSHLIQKGFYVFCIYYILCFCNFCDNAISVFHVS